jgi:hypothetical protein
MSAKSSILIRPAGKLPMVTSKKTIGFLGLGGLRCHSKAILALPLSSTNLQSLTTTIYMKKKKKKKKSVEAACFCIRVTVPGTRV